MEPGHGVTDLAAWLLGLESVDYVVTFRRNGGNSTESVVVAQ